MLHFAGISSIMYLLKQGGDILPELKPDCPILDGLMAGQCYSDHDGVRCYPAIQLETSDKYIIKVISIPASPSQMEALMLAGAIADTEDAKRYFRTLADGVVEEAHLLNELASLEGFIGCSRIEMEEDAENNGYLVYLLTPYQEAVDLVLTQGAMTHLGAINMGLDLCSALVACRRSGNMYVDLKPTNIYKTEKGNYCIGDLGFISLKGMKYASLPGKYRSSYTAPEMADCFAELNDTLDIFALGMILYQAYNGGKLLYEGTAPAELPAPPMYADYELAEIILKACHPDPCQRWQDPAQLGQALAGYMQRNPVDDIPIVPLPVEEEPQQEQETEEAVEEFLPEMTQEELDAAMAEEDTAAESEDDELVLIAALAAEDSSSELNVLAAEDSDVSEQEASEEETAQMLAQADELMTLTPPEPVVAPEAVHVPDPAPIDDDAALVAAVSAEPEAIESKDATDNAEDSPVDAPAPKQKKLFPWAKVIVTAVVLFLLAGIGFGAYYYYNYEYLQYIDAIQITGTDHTATVTVVTKSEEGILYVTLTDSYGNSHNEALVNGTATFTNLNPQTRYTVELQVIGFHELRGDIVDHFTTATQTEILSFQATIGPVDCSVNLSFTSAGPQPDSWKVIATADGQPTIVEEFTGNSVTVSGLHAGSHYTFLLEPVGELYMSGQTAVEFTATNIILAQDPQIIQCQDGMLHIVWSIPEGETVGSWTLRCYNASGYDVTVTTSDPEYVFHDVDHSSVTTVEITAAGMIKSVSTSICANPITVLDYSFQPQGDGTILLSWNFAGVAPAEGWQLAWYIDGVAQQLILTDTNSALIPLEIPGSHYAFSLSIADGTYIFNPTFEDSVAQAEAFSGNKLTAADLLCQTFRAPNKKNWTYKNVTDSCITSEFALNEQIYLMLSTSKTIVKSSDPITLTCVLRSADGTFLSIDSQDLVWNDMWVKKHCIIELPSPAEAGEYVMYVYMNSMLLCELPLSIS